MGSGRGGRTRVDVDPDVVGLQDQEEPVEQVVFWVQNVRPL